MAYLLMSCIVVAYIVRPSTYGLYSNGLYIYSRSSYVLHGYGLHDYGHLVLSCIVIACIVIAHIVRSLTAQQWAVLGACDDYHLVKRQMCP